MKRHDVDTNMDTEKVSRIRCGAVLLAEIPAPVADLVSFYALAWSIWPDRKERILRERRVSDLRKERTSISR